MMRSSMVYSLISVTKLLAKELQPSKLPIAARHEFCQLKQASDDVATSLRKLSGRMRFQDDSGGTTTRSAGVWSQE